MPACRAAAASRPPVHVDLDLTSLGRPCPAAFDEDVTEAPGSAPELSVTTPPNSQEVLTPAPALSYAQELFQQ